MSGRPSGSPGEACLRALCKSHTVDDIAEVYGVTRHCVYRWLKQHDLHAAASHGSRRTYSWEAADPALLKPIAVEPDRPVYLVQGGA